VFVRDLISQELLQVPLKTLHLHLGVFSFGARQELCSNAQCDECWVKRADIIVIDE
jgi:hypothetical protein